MWQSGENGKIAAKMIMLPLLGTLWLAGCQKQKQGDEGKTYTPDAKQGPQGGGGGQQTSQGNSTAGQAPLGTPADTTNGKSSKASDAGTSDAVRGQVVAEPGAPIAHEPKPTSRSHH